MLTQLKFIGSKVWEFLRPLIVILLSNVGPALISAATAAVAAAEAMPNATGDEKKAAATAAALAILKSKGVEVGTAVLNAAIENAVVALKG